MMTGGAPMSLNQKRAVFRTSVLWTWGAGEARELNVKFLDGDAWVKAWVTKIVKEKLEPVINVKFNFYPPENTTISPDITITFNTSMAASLLGTGSLSATQQGTASMSLGWVDHPGVGATFTFSGVTYTVPDNEYTRETQNYTTGATVIHEFGHALGMEHEHQNPFGVPMLWNEAAVKEYFMKPVSEGGNGWNAETVQTNILDTLMSSNVNGSVFDPKSIMLYAFGPGMSTNYPNGVSSNPELSELDKTWLTKMYGYGSATTPKSYNCDPVDGCTGLSTTLGTYATAAACTAACTKYACGPTGCGRSTAGYDTEAACTAACTKYKCDGVKGCILSTDGAYATEAACKTACSKYDCDPTNGCVYSTTGAYDTATACETACSKFKCDPDTGCVHTTGGPYSSAAECATACSAFKCHDTKGCIYSVGGEFPTKGDCTTACQRYSCTGSNGVCALSATGSLYAVPRTLTTEEISANDTFFESQCAKSGVTSVPTCVVDDDAGTMFPSDAGCGATAKTLPCNQYKYSLVRLDNDGAVIPATTENDEMDAPAVYWEDPYDELPANINKSDIHKGLNYLHLKKLCLNDAGAVVPFTKCEGNTADPVIYNSSEGGIFRPFAFPDDKPETACIRVGTKFYEPLQCKQFQYEELADGAAGKGDILKLGTTTNTGCSYKNASNMGPLSIPSTYECPLPINTCDGWGNKTSSCAGARCGGDAPDVACKPNNLLAVLGSVIAVLFLVAAGLFFSMRRN